MQQHARRGAGLLALLITVLVAPASALAASPAGPPAASRASAAGATVEAPAPPPVVRQRPCPDDSIFTCITIRVPRDHFGAPDGPTVDVTFALHRAATPNRKGVFVTVTGGPG